MKFLLDVFKGIMIGAGAILPGISSGVLCVVFGIYDKLLDSVLNFFSDVSRSVKFLFPILIGGVIGVILFSKVLQFLLYAYPLQTKSLFIGLILGGITLLFKEIKNKEKFRIRNLLFLFLSLIMGIFMVYIENKLGGYRAENISYIYLLFSGFFMSVGIVVPGVSSTIILMLLGVYSLYLTSVSTLYLPVLVPMGIGIVIGSLIFMKIIKLLLDKYYVQTMYLIIGFTIGSAFVLFPEICVITDAVISVLCVIWGYCIIKILKLA